MTEVYIYCFDIDFSVFSSVIYSREFRACAGIFLRYLSVYCFHMNYIVFSCFV